MTFFKVDYSAEFTVIPSLFQGALNMYQLPEDKFMMPGYNELRDHRTCKVISPEEERLPLNKPTSCHHIFLHIVARLADNLEDGVSSHSNTLFLVDVT